MWCCLYSQSLKAVRKRREIPRVIIDFLSKQEWPSTTENIAVAVNVSWNTAQVWLLKLANEGRVKYRKVGRQNQWWLVRKYEKGF